MAVTNLSKITTDAGVSTRGIGNIRTVPISPAFNFDALIKGAKNLATLPNPNNSTGCSPIIRAFLVQSGLPFRVQREYANDGGTTGHSTGDALDIMAVSGSPNSQAALADIVELLRLCSGMFVRLSHLDTDFSDDSISAGFLSTALINSTKHSIHLDSTVQVMQTWLTTGLYKSQRNDVLGFGTGSPFGVRTVNYDDTSVKHNVKPNAGSPAAKGVNFW